MKSNRDDRNDRLNGELTDSDMFAELTRGDLPGGISIPPGGALAIDVSSLLAGMLGGKRGDVIDGDEVEFTKNGKIAVPEGMTYQQAIKILRRMHEESETVTSYTQAFNYRPHDGAYATFMVLRERYGMVMGEIIRSMFGDKPPELINVKIGVGKTEQVPWGLISVPTLDGTEMMLCGRHTDSEGQPIFDLHVQAPRKHRREIEAIFAEIERFLQENSIYRGKAVHGVQNLDFLDLAAFNADEIALSDEVLESLEGNVWSILRYADIMRAEGMPLRRSVLLHGPFGTGKTSVGMMTGQIAVENGWTFISAKAGRDNIADVMQLAKQYQPAVVFFEDLDTQAQATNNGSRTSELLDVFDGIATKGIEIVLVMTTNHVDRVQKGMMRPGRLDVLVEIAELDRNGTERLIKAVVAEGKLDPTIDYDVVYEAMQGFLPAFVRGAVDRARSFAIARTGRPDFVLTTEDLVKSAISFRPQFKALQEAKEADKVPTLDLALSAAVTAAAQQAIDMVEVRHGNSKEFTLRVPELAANGQHNGHSNGSH